MESKTRSLTLWGTILALASPGLMYFLNYWEDGGKKQETYVVYADSLAGGLATACNGITEWTSPVPVIVGDVWTKAKCDEIGQQIVETTQRGLAKFLRVAVPQSIFDALSSHAHNVGVGSTCASLAVARINDGRSAEGCDLIAWTPEGRPNWSFVRGRFVQGLHNRRLSERRLCLQGAEL